MAKTYIPIGRGASPTPLAGVIRNNIDRLTSAVQQLAQAQAVIATMLDNPAAPADFTTMEAQLGACSRAGGASLGFIYGG